MSTAQPTPAQQTRKALVAVLTLGVNAATALLTVGGVLPQGALPYVTAFLLLAGSYGVYAVPNKAGVTVVEPQPASEPEPTEVEHTVASLPVGTPTP